MPLARASIMRKPISSKLPSLFASLPAHRIGGANPPYSFNRRMYETESGGGERVEKTNRTKAQLLSPEIEEARRAAKSYLPDFELHDKVVVVTGGGRGLGLTMAQALYQAGAKVYCLDRLPRPSAEFLHVQKDTPSELGGELVYHHIDLRQSEKVQQLISDISDEHGRIDGLVAAAGIQQVTPALEYPPEDMQTMMDINYVSVFVTAQAVAKQMYRYNTPGSIVLVSSMSAFVANKGLRSPVYNSSKAAVAQLARNLAMEWGKDKIRVNALCPGNILTPMVKKNFEDEPELKEIWESSNMLGRISTPEEFRGVGIFLLSDASSFVTGSSIVVDGGYTAW